MGIPAADPFDFRDVEQQGKSSAFYSLLRVGACLHGVCVCVCIAA